MSPYSENYCDFQGFFYFEMNAGRSRKKAEISQNAGFPARLRAFYTYEIILSGIASPVTNVARIKQDDSRPTRQHDSSGITELHVIGRPRPKLVGHLPDTEGSNNGD